MSLDTRYYAVNTFQEVFRDKDSGCPLAGGIVKFYRDEARTEEKPVYQLSGTPGNYTYTPIGSTLVLSSYGTFQDPSNNDITVYLFPYDDSGNVDLYYATVESSGSIAQFTREAIPNISAAGQDEEVAEGYIPNGQFILHNNIPADDAIGSEAGQIVRSITDIAQGGWTYERSDASSAIDFVKFNRIGSYVEIPDKSPRYSLQVKCQTASGSDAFKRVIVKFNDVNKFASDSDTFTFSFSAKSNTGAPFDIKVRLIKNYGAGGDPEEIVTLQNITLTTEYVIYSVPLIFGTNEGKNIGENDDDFVAFCIEFPATTTFDGEFDNFLLNKGQLSVTQFTYKTNENTVRDSLMTNQLIPSYDNSDLYLPIRLGLNGLEFDRDIIGSYIIRSSNNLHRGELWCDGGKYLTANYSEEQIPYFRLYDKLSAQSPFALPLYGPGQNEMYFSQNDTGIDQEYVDGMDVLRPAGPMWQSFTAGVSGNLTSVAFQLRIPFRYGVTLKIYSGEGTGGTELSTQSVQVDSGWNTFHLASTVPVSIGTKYTIYIGIAPPILKLDWVGSFSGDKYSGGRSSADANADGNFKTFIDQTSSNDYRLVSTSAGAVTPAADGTITPTGFTFTPIQPDPYIVDITCVAGSSLTAGAYWTYNTTDSRIYVIWYTVDGVGVVPAETADVFLQVDVLSTDDILNVANKTARVINGYIYSVPDFRGYFMRVTDNGIGIDPDAVSRINRGDGTIGDAVGTKQDDAFKSHSHTVAGIDTGTNLAEGTDFTAAGSSSTFPTGGNETRPKNIYVNLAIKY